jgi:predicted amidohydrolase
VTRVVCCELAPVVGDLDGNLALAAAAVRAAAGAGIVVLPELVTSGYCFASAAEARSVAISADHPALGEWGSHGSIVVGGFAELGEDGAVHNSAALVDASGVRAVYRKTHLWDRETLFFTPGTDPAPVVETAVGRIGVMICYDQEFPEMPRSVALRGADLLALPTNWPWVDRPPGQPAPEVLLAMASARVNRMAAACCDRRGVERGQRWNEASTIIGADGWPLATADAGSTVIAEVDLLASRDKQISPHNDVHRDRRPDVYR